MRYRVFINYCVVPSNVVIFLNSASSAAALVFDLPLCKHTVTEGKPREAIAGSPPPHATLLIREQMGL